MIRRITSLQNETVKAVRALHGKKARERGGVFIAEGLKIVADALDAGHAPQILLFGGKATGHPLVERAAAAAREALEVTDEILAKVSRRDNPQTVIGVFAETTTALAALDPASAASFVALCRARDPGNVGTIIRTADAAAAGAVILVGETCDPFAIEAVRATMGSIFAVPIVRTGEESFAAWRRDWPGTVVGALPSAKTDYRAARVSPPLLLVMGAEQSGLTPEMAALCDITVRIPMAGRADSLNLAVAAGIALFALAGPD